MKTKNRKILLQITPYMAVIITFIAFIGFYFSALNRYTEQFLIEFKRKNINELNSGAIYKLAAQLKDVSSVENVICIQGISSGTTFFSSGVGCNSSGLLSRVVLLTSDSKSIQIVTVLTLPSEIKKLFFIFFAFLLVVMGVLYWSSRSLESLDGMIRVEWVQRELLLLKKTLEEEARKSQLGVVATQVAHDIRSPLAALEMVVQASDGLPEEKRILIRSAVSRIKDIANDLLQKNRESFQENQKGQAKELAAEKPATLLLASLVDSVVTEKRMQFRSAFNVAIDARLDRAAYGLFIEVNSIAFKRVLSNLINNAVEAIQGAQLPEGQVLISAKRTSHSKVELCIQDNGPGIPESVISKLGVRGETHGKSNGSGLGMFHAKNTIKEFGGDLIIESSCSSNQLNIQGTSIKIVLPEAKQPTWFVQKIVVPEKSKVVILDDDDSIHQIWKGRFDSAMAKQHSIELVHFYSIDPLVNALESSKGTLGLMYYLFDYEILGDSRSGLDLIEELGLGSKAILVTSRFEETEIRIRCDRLGVRLIPKGLSGFVPIEVVNNAIQVTAKPAQLTVFDCVLLDDDALIHTIWQAQAKRAGKKLLSVYSEGELLPQLKRLAKNCPIYVDSNLSSNQKGEEVARRLHEMGFESIYLATGYDPSHFGEMPWLKGIVGKEPPLFSL